ncbi:MAG: hypothetical protein M3167_11825 [Acidobacteriota bacterium]|nr:hypothetical protein [Acidobacteriota bacterium]
MALKEFWAALLGMLLAVPVLAQHEHHPELARSSVFRGEEPDERRWDIEGGPIDFQQFYGRAEVVRKERGRSPDHTLPAALDPRYGLSPVSIHGYVRFHAGMKM